MLECQSYICFSILTFATFALSFQEAPDEAALSNTNADSTTELNDEKPADGTPTIEQCDVSVSHKCHFSDSFNFTEIEFRFYSFSRRKS